MLTAEPHDHLRICAQLRDHPPERRDDILTRVGLIACPNRRVRRKHGPRSRRRERLLDRDPARNLLPCQLEHRKRGMPVVQMHQRRLDAHRLQRTDAADAQ